MTRSNAEESLATILRWAGIPFEREVRFAPPRRWRADFAVGAFMRSLPVSPAGRGAPEPTGGLGHSIGPMARPDASPTTRPLLVEIDGGAWVNGRHSRGAGVEADCEKACEAAILGYRVLRVTPRMVEDGRALALIRRALG